MTNKKTPTEDTPQEKRDGLNNVYFPDLNKSVRAATVEDALEQINSEGTDAVESEATEDKTNEEDK